MGVPGSFTHRSPINALIHILSCRQIRENVDEGIDRGAVAGVLQAHVGLEFIKEGFKMNRLRKSTLSSRGIR